MCVWPRGSLITPELVPFIAANVGLLTPNHCLRDHFNFDNSASFELKELSCLVCDLILDQKPFAHHLGTTLAQILWYTLI